MTINKYGLLKRLALACCVVATVSFAGCEVLEDPEFQRALMGDTYQPATGNQVYPAAGQTTGGYNSQLNRQYQTPAPQTGRNQAIPDPIELGATGAIPDPMELGTTRAIPDPIELGPAQAMPDPMILEDE